MRQFFARLTRAPFALAWALSTLINGIRAFVDPRASIVYTVLPHWVGDIWAGVYALGGLMLGMGMGTARPDVETAGCVFIGGGAVTQSLVYLVKPNFGRTTGYSTVVVLFALGALALLRAWHLAHGDRFVWVKVP